MSQSPDPFEFLKSLWAPMGVPVPGMVTPTLDVSEIDKRIADLKSVESWLNLNLNVLRMTIQGLEMQRSTLSAMQTGMVDAARMMQGQAATPADATASSGGANSMDAWWSVLQQVQQAAEQMRAGVPGDKKIDPEAKG